MGIFSNAQGHLTPQSIVKSRGISNSAKISWMSLLHKKNEEDLIKNNKVNAWTRFSHYKSMGIFSNAQRQITPRPVVRSGWISNSSKLLYKLLFLASMEKIKLKIAEIMRGQHFLHTKSMGVVCCHGNQSSNSICFKT